MDASRFHEHPPVEDGNRRVARAPGHVQDLGLRAARVAVVNQALQDARRGDAGAAHDDAARRGGAAVVDVLVRLVGMDDVPRAGVARAKRDEVGQEPRAGVTERDVHVLAAIGDRGLVVEPPDEHEVAAARARR